MKGCKCSKGGFLCSEDCSCGEKCKNAEHIVWNNSENFESTDIPFKDGMTQTRVYSPLECFLLFFNEKLTNEIFKSHNQTCPESSKIKWMDALPFYIILLCMIIDPQSKLSFYWKDQTTSMFHGSKVIPKIMPRDRWKFINSAVKAGQHCQPIFDALQENIRQHYLIANYVAVDEWVPFYKGKNPIGVWMKCKPSGIGFKVYVLADMNGIPYSFILYQGTSLKMADVVLKMEETLPKESDSC